MRVVLHIGQQRSGTTAIQNAFFDHRAGLAEQGVLYPVVKYAGINPRRHHMLATVLDLATLPRGLKARFDGRDSVPPSETVAAFEGFARKVQKVIRTTPPKVLVLSSEMMFRDLSDAAAVRLKTWFGRIGDEATVGAYLRKPSETFASNLWQSLYSRGVVAANPSSFRSQVESWHRGFGEALKLAVYDRAQLHRGDIVADFVHRFLPEIGDETAIASGDQVNASSTAEIMAVMADVAARARDERSTDPRLAPHNMEPVLKDLAAQRGIVTGRPRLRPEFAAYVDHASHQVTWLRDTFGLIFRGIDYDRVGRVNRPVLSDRPGVADFCEVNEAARAELARAFEDWYARQQASG